MFELTIEIPFSAAHRICGHPGLCAGLHGHNYRALIRVVGEQLDELGMLMDFAELKRICAEVVAPLDHSYLNDLPQFAHANPTAEALARHLHLGVVSSLAAASGNRVRVSEVSVFESERSSATYRER